MEIHIEGQHTEVAPDLQSWITAHLEALDAPYHDVLHGRVTLVKSERHRHGSDEARVLLSLAGKTLSATRTGDTLEDALYAVMQVIERALHDFRDMRRGIVKEPGPRPRGHIVSL
ncbi:MAG TPA: HPF/RaiA family ribosome-associated protein, partial [Candidatus Tectomicrobia bacterium]